MSLPAKALLIMAVITAALFYDIPTLRTFMPQEPGAKVAHMKTRLSEIKDLVEPLQVFQLALADPKKGRIQLLMANESRVPLENPILKGILKDQFSLEKAKGEVFLVLKPEYKDKTFISKVGSELDGLFTNLRKVTAISLGQDGKSIVLALKPGRRLSDLTDPLKSMLGDDLESFYKEELNHYQLRAKGLDNVVSLGLDLQGGMYLDIGVEVDVVVQNVLQRTSEAMESVLLDEAVNYDSVELDEDQNILINLEADEQLDLSKDIYQRLVEPDYIAEKTDAGYKLTLKPEEAKRIKKRGVEQALETIRNRIDQLGVKEPSIQRRGDDSIIIQLPGLDDPDKARRVIGQVAVLNFLLVSKDGTPETLKDDQVLLYNEVRDPITKEVTSQVPYVLERKVLLQGDMIRDARVSFSQTGQASVSMSFNSEGSETFADITGANVGRQLAIVLDNKVQSAPRMNEKIEGGQAQITGSFSPEEASELALVLRSGALPAPIIVHEERTIGASLGADSIRQAMISLVIGFVAVMIFMVIYYKVSGLFSVIALLGNIALIIAALAYFQATLTLPGMAGIVLTIGMAVDANVLIFERIREELAKGTRHRTAIQLGFQKATVTILDSNITTILAAIILFQFGTGPIKGFAVTLSIGILASMFTAIFVGKFLFELVYLTRSKLDKISI